MAGHETLYDGPSLVAALVADMREIDAATPIAAKLEMSLREIEGYFKSHHGQMLRPTHNGLREVIAILTAGFEREKAEARRRCVAEAAKGALGPKRILRAVDDAHEITDRMIGGGR